MCTYAWKVGVLIVVKPRINMMKLFCGSLVLDFRGRGYKWPKEIL